MRAVMLGILLVVATASAILAAPMSGSAKMLGGGNDTVPHSQVLDTSIPANNTVSTVNAQVKSDTTGNYIVTASVSSGATSGSGQTPVTLTANIAQPVSISISPAVSISGSTYSIEVRVKK